MKRGAARRLRACLFSPPGLLRALSAAPPPPKLGPQPPTTDPKPRRAHAPRTSRFHHLFFGLLPTTRRSSHTLVPPSTVEREPPAQWPMTWVCAPPVRTAGLRQPASPSAERFDLPIQRAHVGPKRGQDASETPRKRHGPGPQGRASNPGAFAVPPPLACLDAKPLR